MNILPEEHYLLYLGVHNPGARSAFPAAAIDNVGLLATVVDEEFLPGAVALAHRKPAFA